MSVYEVKPEYRSFVEPFVQAAVDCDGLLLWESDAVARRRAYVGGVEQALVRCAESAGAALGLDETEIYRTYDRLLAELRRSALSV